MDASDEQLIEAVDETVFRPSQTPADFTWCCVYTRPRHEKAVARDCLRLDIDFYLPLRRTVHHYKSGRKTYWRPLFPGYLFCRKNQMQEMDLSRQERVLSVINVNDEEKFLHELRQIYLSLSISDDLASVPYLASGCRVEIVRGPFRGIEGVVEKSSSSFRVMLIVTMMNRSVPLEVDAGDVEPI